MSFHQQLFYAGTSGLSVPFPRSQYPAEYQQKSRLEFYASICNSIEVNSIFYKLPRPKTVVNWAANVPGDFRFTFKVPKAITHTKDLKFIRKDVLDFIDTIGYVGDKKGCILLQLPPSLRVEMLDRLQKLLETLGEAIYSTRWTIAVEFRDQSWYEREVYELLHEFGAITVTHDMTSSAAPSDTPKSNVIYLRFHGTEPRYRGTYSDEFLKQYAGYILTWLQQKKTVYAYFNNTAGSAFRDLERLKQYLPHPNEKVISK